MKSSKRAGRSVSSTGASSGRGLGDVGRVSRTSCSGTMIAEHYSAGGRHGPRRGVRGAKPPANSVLESSPRGEDRLDLELLRHDVTVLSGALAAIATALMLVTLAKYAFGRLVLSGVKLDEELFIRDNPAAAIIVLGYGTALLAIALGVVGTGG